MKDRVPMLLLWLSVGCLLVAAIIGFGFTDHADTIEDFTGWVVAGGVFFVASHAWRET